MKSITYNGYSLFIQLAHQIHIHPYPFDFDSKAVQVFGEEKCVCVLSLALQDLIPNNWK